MSTQRDVRGSSWGRVLRVAVGAGSLATLALAACSGDSPPDGTSVDEGNVQTGADGGGGGETRPPFEVDASSETDGSATTSDDGSSPDDPSTRDGAASSDDGGAGSDADVAPKVECSPISNGTMKLKVNGKERSFIVKLPNDTSQMALLFEWHGWMTDPAKFGNEIVYDVPAGKWVPFDPNAFPMPLMIVTAVDTKMIPPFGLDWDIRDGSTDFPYFEAMLQCINEQYSIDKTRVYSFGFSAGAVFTNLLSAKYPKLFAATIAESGMWYNDKNQWSDVKFGFIMDWKWPAFDPADRGNVLLTHGGKDDYATVADLESANKKAIPFLHDNGRTVVECSHTVGHVLDPDLTQAMYYDYMWSHRLGGPPLSALVPSFPTPEKPLYSTKCVLHPAP